MNFSGLLPFVITGAGIFLLFRLRFFFVLHPVKCLRGFLSELRTPASRASLALALSGTLGVGNIFGTAAGLMIGGAGSIFWLLFSAVFSMVIKYSEAALAIDLKDGTRGGMQYIILKVFGKRAGIFASAYAVLCLCMALFVGSALQSSAVTDTINITLEITPAIGAMVLSLLLLLAVMRGSDRIERISTVIIPIATAIYVILSASVILLRISNIPSVFYRIFTEAFKPSAVGGGVLAFFTSRAMAEGFTRGMLSNEAGIGTSTMAHSRSSKRAPEIAGLFGISEIFFDTVLLCTVTGVVILSSVPDISAYATPMSLVVAAFENTLGAPSVYILTACMFLFGFSTIICWYYYGSECYGFIFGESRTAIYTFGFIFSLFFGALIDTEPLLYITDMTIFFMALISLTAVIKETKRLEYLTDRLIK